jgi:hypothetical protein
MPGSGGPTSLSTLAAARSARAAASAEQHVGSKYVDQVLDSLYVIEMAMRHFYMR